MKTTTRVIIMIMLTGMAAACSRSENSSSIGIGERADSVQRIAPTSDGIPSVDPTNPASPPDTAVQVYDSATFK